MNPPSLHVDGATACILLDRPEVANRLSPQDLVELERLIREVNAQANIRVLILGSQGRHFCSGYDIGSLGHTAAQEPAAVDFESMVNALEDSRPVTIARLQGGVFGGATDLALACDFRVGTPACRMFMPAARLGLHYYGRGMQRYVSRLGLNTAKRLFLMAEELDATRMLEVGFLTDLVESETLDAHIDAMAANLASMAPLALLGMKKHLNRIARGALDREELRRDMLAASLSDDLREGAAAFRERRPPTFRGR